MGYLLLSPSPPLAFQYPSAFGGAACRRSRGRRGAAFVAASSASSPPDGGPSPSSSSSTVTASADASYVLARRVVLLGASALPLVSLREAAAATTTEAKDVSKLAAPQSEGTKGMPKPDNPQLEGTQAETTTTEARQLESSLQSVEEQPPGNPLVGFLSTVAVAASGVLGGLYGTSLQEKKALQSIISSVNHLQTCS